MVHLSDGLDNTDDGAEDALELLLLGSKLFAAGGSQFVVAGAAIAGSDAPLGRDQAFDEHALERRVERTFFDLEHVVGGALDGVGDLVAVQLAVTGKGPEDQKIKGAGGNLVSLHYRCLIEELLA